MVRSYRPRAYDWTPLSRNPARKCNGTFLCLRVGRQQYSGPSGSGGTATVSRTSRPVWTIVSCREVTGTTNPMRRGGAKSFVDDLGWSRGVVLSRAATLLRSIETQPYDSKICSLLDEHTSLSWKERKGRRWWGISFLLFPFPHKHERWGPIISRAIERMSCMRTPFMRALYRAWVQHHFNTR